MFKKRRRLTPEEKQEIYRAALDRIRSSPSMGNFAPVIEEFSARGIDPDTIDPKTNVLTYNAWKALRRHVRRGEHGVKITTYAPIEPKPGEEPAPGEQTERKLRPVTAVVFHISQTDPDDEAAAS